MDWQPVVSVNKGPLYQDPRGGEICVVARGHAVPADLCATPGLRAQAVIAHVRSRAVLVDHAAVFVHTGLWTVNPRTIRQIPTAPLPGRSTRWTSDRRLLKDDHVVRLGGVPVTTMVRTAADLLCLDPDRGIPGVLALLRAGLDGDDVVDFLGDRFRGLRTGKISLLCEQLSASVERDLARR